MLVLISWRLFCWPEKPQRIAQSAQCGIRAARVEFILASLPPFAVDHGHDRLGLHAALDHFHVARDHPLAVQPGFENGVLLCDGGQCVNAIDNGLVFTPAVHRLPAARGMHADAAASGGYGLLDRHAHRPPATVSLLPDRKAADRKAQAMQLAGAWRDAGPLLLNRPGGRCCHEYISFSRESAPLIFQSAPKAYGTTLCRPQTASGMWRCFSAQLIHSPAQTRTPTLPAAKAGRVI